MDDPIVLGPLDEDEYIEQLAEEFRQENHRGPYGAAELLHWHRRQMNKHLRELGYEVTGDLRLERIAKAEVALNYVEQGCDV